MNWKKTGVAVAALAAAGAVVAAAANANAETTTATPAASSTYSNGRSQPQGNDTSVTGDELSKVTAAVTAKDSGVTVTSVQKDPDGSYDVFATKDSAKVRYEVSADLATITQNTGAGGRGGGPGGSNDTPVTGDELSKVTAAVTAKDSGVTVTSVQKDPDGSYDVFATKDSAKVRYEVSADLATITQNTGAGGAGGGPAGGRGGAPSGSMDSSSTTSQS